MRIIHHPTYSERQIRKCYIYTYMATEKDNFFQQVMDVARQIPRGRVTSYGAIAKYLGAARSARIVGWAMGQSGGQFPAVPAHRVVNRNGLLTGQHQFAYPGRMQELLEREGIEVKGQQIQDFKELFWDPMQELPPLV